MLLALALALVLPACGEDSGGGASTVSWTGPFGKPGGDPVSIRFAIAEANGQLSGQMYLQDPNSKQWLPDADFTGVRSGDHATWSTTTQVMVDGDFAGAEFTGTITFPADAFMPAPHVVPLRLLR